MNIQVLKTARSIRSNAKILFKKRKAIDAFKKFIGIEVYLFRIFLFCRREECLENVNLYYP